MDKRIGFGIAWVVATVLAVTIGVVAVSTAGASLRGRGPVGENVGLREASADSTPGPDPTATKIRERIAGDWGAFVVECQGTYAYGIRTEPAEEKGWRIVSYEEGPDDDVDAVFSNGRNSVDLEVFCNAGRPTVAEIERNTLAE